MNEFIHCFINVVKLYPDNIAILVNGKEAITYHELFRRALFLSHNLKHFIYPKSLVAISQPKSIDYIVSMLAIWMRGAAFLPLDPELPFYRKAQILDIAKPNVRLSENGEVIHYHHHKIFPENLAYVIFTSGSTGLPKGVMISHEGIVNFIEEQISVFQFEPSSRSLWYLSLAFDASISDIGTALLSGATLCIEKDLHSLAVSLPKLVHSRGITHIDIPPALLSILEPTAFSNTLKTIIIGGEICQPEAVRLWSKIVRVVNVYGPTEATVCTSMKVCSENWQEPNIGKPIKNMHYTLLDSTDELAELYIAGKGLAMGYLHNPKLNAEKFIIFNGQRYYRTGDLVYQRPDGDYVFAGRIDRQFKINGQLVAPEEIETKLQEMPGVEKAAIIVFDNHGKKHLVAFVQTKVLSEHEILTNLKNRLSCWMLPQRVILRNKLPQTASGKIDYKQLQNLYSKLEKIYFGVPLSEEIIERTLQKIWRHALRQEGYPHLEADFFGVLGGDSLAALEMVLLAEKEGFAIPIELLSQYRTIRLLAQWLKRERDAHENKPQSASWLKEVVCKELLEKSQRSTVSGVSQNDEHTVLLTGATGFLGIYLLSELLKQTNKKIVCLVRAINEKQAYLRICQTAVNYQIIFSENQLTRLILVPGDITRPHLGMSEENWHTLSETVGEVIHAGAVVNMQKEYEALKQANMYSLREIVAFSQKGREKKINYISTLSVFAATDRSEGICYEEEDLSATQKIYGGYAQTKWAAEYYLLQLKKQGSPITLFRLGLITGNSKTGVYSSHDFLHLFLKGLLAIGCYPEGEWNHLEMDVTPVDYAAKAIVAIVNKGEPHCFHIVNSKRFSFSQIVDNLQGLYYPLQKVSNKDWCKHYTQYCVADAKQAIVYMSLCRTLQDNKSFEKYRTMDLFQSTNLIFDQKNTLQQLKGTGIVCPEAGDKLLSLYMEKMIG